MNHTTALACIVLVLVPICAQAQMTGTYTIDASLPPSITNFQTTTAAAAALVSAGVIGPVTFLIQRQPATPTCANPAYAPFDLPPILGSSSSNTITFIGVGGYPAIRGLSPAAAVPGVGGCIRLFGPGTGLGGPPGAGPTDIVLKQLDVSTGGAGVAIGVSGGARISIIDCKVHDSSGGIWVDNTLDAMVVDNDVYDINPSAAPVCSGGPCALTPELGALAVTSRSHNAEVRRNRVHDSVTWGITVGGTAPALLGVPIGPFPSNNVVCVNNFIWNVSGHPNYPSPFPGGGLVFGLIGSASTVANNSIAMTPGSTALATAPGIHFWTAASAGPPHTVYNNIVLQTSPTQPCVAVLGISPGTTLPQNLNSNHYNHAGPGPIARVGRGAGATLYTTLPAWQGFTAPREASSVSGPVGFVSASDLHLTAGSASIGLPHPQVSRDIDGNTRSLLFPHMGADEIGVVLSMSQIGGPAGPLSNCAPAVLVSLDNYGLTPGNDYYNIFSLPCPGGPGTGPGQFLGLCPINPLLITLQLLLPTGSPPWHFTLSPFNVTGYRNHGAFTLPPGTVLDAVCFDFTGGVIGPVSPVARLTVR